MAAETTDPLETVMEAVVAYRAFMPVFTCRPKPELLNELIEGQLGEQRERLRLTVQLALAKARYETVKELAATTYIDGVEPEHWLVQQPDKIAALEARLQEQE